VYNAARVRGGGGGGGRHRQSSRPGAVSSESEGPTSERPTCCLRLFGLRFSGVQLLLCPHVKRELRACVLPLLPPPPPSLLTILRHQWTPCKSTMWMCLCGDIFRWDNVYCNWGVPVRVYGGVHLTFSSNVCS
ncbi:unnamed protein product, partial [Ectocarpus sp. 12 AP-2014]